MPTPVTPAVQLRHARRWVGSLRDTLRRVPVSRLLCVAVCGLLLLPNCFRGVTDGPEAGLKLGSPRLYSGDEPHYMVAVTSLVRDFDLDLANNYDSLRKGGNDGGRRWGQLRLLDNHTCFLLDGKQVFWGAVYNPTAPPDQWRADSYGRALPPRLAGMPEVPPDTPEYSFHQVGIAYVLAPVLMPFRNSRYLESVALLCSGLAVVGGFLFFRMLLWHLGADAWTVNLASIAAFLGTPAWWYGRSLFMEGFLLFFIMGAYALVLCQNRALLAGIFLGLAAQLKLYVLLLAAPLFFDLACRRELRKAALFTLPLVVGFGLCLLQNKVFYGGWLSTPQPFTLGKFREGALGQLFHPRVGLFFMVPVAAVAVLCWPKFAVKFPRYAAVLGAGFLLNYLLLANWLGWQGMAYGPRYLVPVLPLLFASFAAAGPRFACPPLGARLATFVTAVSIAMTATATFHYCKYWIRNPALDLAAHLRDQKV